MTTLDALVVGGGPGGAIAATAIALRGHRVAILEKETGPCYKVGESLLPSINGIAGVVGFRERLAQAGFVIKRGGTLRWGRTSEPWSFRFAASPKLEGSTSFSYQVERKKFDALLLEHARDVGVEVHSGCRANRLLFGSNGRAQGVSYTDASGTRREIRARYVIDASGHASRFYAQVGASRIPIPELRNMAVYCYYDGGVRLSEPYAGDVVSEAVDGCWFWYIPLNERLTSVGLVLLPPTQAHLREHGPAATFDAMLARSNIIQEMLADATRISDDGDYGRFRVRRDFSYTTDRFWSDGLALIGDAACFVDPVFATGVHLATYAGLLVGRSVNTALDRPSAEARAFAEFEYRYRREFAYIYQFLQAWYDLNKERDDILRTAADIVGGSEDDDGAFLRLVSGVAATEDALGGVASAIDGVRTALQAVASNDAATWPEELLGNSTFREMMRESSHLQRAAVSGVGERRSLAPAGAHLLATADGLGWEPETDDAVGAPSARR